MLGRTQRVTVSMLLVAAASGCSASVLAPSDEFLPAAAATRQAVGTPPSDLVACTTDAMCAMPLLSAGLFHTALLKNDGTVWTTGHNGWGQLGDGTFNQRSTPILVPSLNGLVTVAGGGAHTLAVRSDGTVWAWGNNVEGELGDGATAARGSPIQSVISDVLAVAAGEYHSVALRSDGTVWTWGNNHYGQLGDGTTDSHVTPTQVPDLSGIVAIAAGDYHTVALQQDGTVFGWGHNLFGELGDGTLDQQNRPVAIAGLTAAAIAAGGFHSMALAQDGTVWSWGQNSFGQLGDGTTLMRPAPVAVVGLTNATAVATGYFHSLALKADGSVWAWGKNSMGQLGDGTTTARLTPVPSQLSGARGIAAGYEHSLAISALGIVSAWGANDRGQLGRADAGTLVTVPISINFGFLTDACTSLPACTQGTCMAPPVCSEKGACVDGKCQCRVGFEGALCDHCAPDYYAYPTCKYCQPTKTCHDRGSCDPSGICVCGGGWVGSECQYNDATTCNDHGAAQPDGTCLCRIGYAGPHCEQCAPDYYNYPACIACTPKSTCSAHGTCAVDGTCACDSGFAGPACDHCAPDAYNYPACTSCIPATTCNGHGTCSATGTCECSTGFTGSNCDQCAFGYYDYPTCGTQSHSCSVAPPTLCATGRNNTAYVAGKSQGSSLVLQVWRSNAVGQRIENWGILATQIVTKLPALIETMRSTAWSEFTQCRAQGLLDGTKCQMDTLNSADPCALDGADWGAISAHIYCDLQKATGLGQPDTWFLRPVYAPSSCAALFQSSCDNVYRYAATEGLEPLTPVIAATLAKRGLVASSLLQPSCRPYSTTPYTSVYEASILLDCAYAAPALGFTP